mmetsp:Transcript_63301/g.150992  ORF Transcript_63301/g.150992 Transcript_63301/m.150992 type:complete len:223 (+) Transcript_63301:47-715(+)
MVYVAAAAAGATVAARHHQRRAGGVAAPSSHFHTYDATPSWAVCAERRDSAAKAAQEEIDVIKIMNRYDLNHSGKLEEDQVKCMMQDINDGTEPSAEEVTFIMRMSKAANSAEGDAIARDSVLYAVKVWRCFLHRQKEFRRKLAEFDTDHTGRLDKEQLRQMLVSLNGGKEVKDYEVEWVMKRADVLKDGSVNVMELLVATSAWYAYIDGEAGPSQCCCSIQ